MPNGTDKNYVRLCGAIDGFRVRYGTWPTIARLWPGCIADLRHCLSPEGFLRLRAKLHLVESEGATIAVEDKQGRSYDYGSEGFPKVDPDICAEEWIGAERRQPTPEEVKLYHKQLEELRKQHPGTNWIILADG